MIPQFNTVQGTNFPVPSLGYAVNDAAYWVIPATSYGGSSVPVVIYWYAAATSGNVKWQVEFAAITIGTDTGSIEAKAFATATSTETATNGNTKAGEPTTVTVSSGALDGLAANDFLAIKITRIAASASEMSGDALFLYATVQLA